MEGLISTALKDPKYSDGWKSVIHTAEDPENSSTRDDKRQQQSDSKGKNDNVFGGCPPQNCWVFTVFTIRKESLQNQAGITYLITPMRLKVCQEKIRETLSYIRSFG